MPPYLAGREEEKEQFGRLLEQTDILENMILTGLRGVGKTVLLETLKPVAIQEGWLWVGTDLSESASVSEETIALRLLTDLSLVTSAIVIDTEELPAMGFKSEPTTVEHHLDYETLVKQYRSTPGLVADKLKTTLDTVWRILQPYKCRGLIFAYDEAQNMSDKPDKDQYPLSLLLDVFQSIQRKNIPFMLVLTGLPTLFPQLVEARTFAERMFRVVVLGRLSKSESREAITRPVRDANCPIELDEDSIDLIIHDSRGYPYFIQFMCREVYDAFLQKLGSGQKPSVPRQAITRKLDADFFAGRWAKATDRQRDLLGVIAHLEKSDEEFTVQEVVKKSEHVLEKSFSPSHVNQMLAALCKNGLVYKNRHGKYSFAVPLFGQFILRQTRSE